MTNDPRLTERANLIRQLLIELLRAEPITRLLTHFTDTRHNFSTDTTNHSKQERKTTRVIILNIPEDKTSLQVIDANNQKHEKQTKTKSVKEPRTITATLAELINTSLMYNYVAESSTVRITIWGGEHVKNVGYGGSLELAKKDTNSIYK